MSWEEQGDVLHELLSNGVIMACHLKRTEHLKQCLHVVLGQREPPGQGSTHTCGLG